MFYLVYRLLIRGSHIKYDYVGHYEKVNDRTSQIIKCFSHLVNFDY